MARKRDRKYPGLTLRGGVYQISMTHPVTGERIRESLDTTIREKAIEAYERKKGQAWDEKNSNADVAWTVSELIEWCWREHWSQKENPPTKESLDLALKSLLAEIGKEIAGAIDKQVLRDVRRLRESRDGVSRSTTNRELTYLSFAYNRAIEEGKLKSNPAAKMRSSEDHLKRTRTSTLAEKKMLCAESAGMLNKIIVFAYGTGMDDGEIRRLKPDCVDLDNNIVKTERWKGNKLIRRVVPLDLDPEINLRELLASMNLGKHPYVFHNPAGEMIPKNGLVHAGFPRLCRRLKIENFRFKDIRHSFATDLWRRTHDIVLCSTVLGHRKIDTTMGYINLTASDLVSNRRILVTSEKQEVQKTSKVVH